MENIAPFLFIGVVVLGIGYIVYRNYFYKRPPTPVPKPPIPPTPPVPPVV